MVVPFLHCDLRCPLFSFGERELGLEPIDNTGVWAGPKAALSRAGCDLLPQPTDFLVHDSRMN
jgi:hypothetical protein